MNDNFYSIDRLIEFGMSAAIANQMVMSMNDTIKKMSVPGAGVPVSVKEAVYYAVLDGAQAGPFSVTELSRLINEKKVVKETYIWKPGMKSWDLAENVDEVLQMVALVPPPIPDNISE